MAHQETHSAIVGGENYGQGSSREHAALAPRYLGVRVVIAKTYARIHWQNLINFGILPLTFLDKSDWQHLAQDDILVFENLRDSVQQNRPFKVYNLTKDERYLAQHPMSDRQIQMVLAGSLLTMMRG